MNNHPMLAATASLCLLGLAGGTAFATPATPRPTFHRTPIKSANATHFDARGCAILPSTGFSACFDGSGARFAGTGPVLALRLIGYGRGSRLIRIHPATPAIEGNRASYTHGNVTAWWRALPTGFEEGFTIAKPPRGMGKVTLVLAANEPPTSRHGTLGWGALRYGKLAVTDAAGKTVPATLESAGKRILIRVNDAGAAYPLTVDPMVWMEQKVLASDGAKDGYLGWSLALDGTTALIGSPQCGCIGAAGEAYFFTETNGQWSQAQKIIAGDGASDDQFGWSVALDGTTALLGAELADVNDHPDQGAAYLFIQSNGSWSQAQKISANDGAAGDQFGYSVALEGTTALIGAPFAGSGAGAAYVFTESDGQWNEAAKLTPNDGAAGAHFGWSVALDGTTALIGAKDAAVGARQAQGAAYVFTGTGGNWTQAAKLTAGDGAANDRFGSAVALSGSSALIGADGQSGAAYVFSGAGGGWSQTAKLTPSDGATGDQFGFSVALGDSTAVVGAPGAAINGNGTQGAAYEFTESNGTWSQTRELIASDGSANDQYGYAVTLQDTTALIGASRANPTKQAYQGEAYFYSASDLGLSINQASTVKQNADYDSKAIVTNNGDGASLPVTLTMAVPAAARFISVTSTPEKSCTEKSNVVTCAFGPIADNAGTASADVTYKANGDPGTTIENTASLVGVTPPLSAGAGTSITAGSSSQPPGGGGGGGSFDWPALATLLGCALGYALLRRRRQQ